MTQSILSLQVGNIPPFTLKNFEHQWQQYKENFMRNLIDARFKELVQDASKQPAKTSTTGTESRSTRFDRFRPSEDQHSRESGYEDLVSLRYDIDPVLRNSPTDDVIQVHDEDNQSEFDNSAAGSVYENQ